jgi:hypothetical protein
LRPHALKRHFDFIIGVGVGHFDWTLFDAFAEGADVFLFFTSQLKHLMMLLVLDVALVEILLLFSDILIHF